MELKKASTQDFAPAFLKNERAPDCTNSFVTPSRTPPKIMNKNGHATGRTPIKHRTVTETSITTKTSGMSKCDPNSNDKKFKSLNEII